MIPVCQPTVSECDLAAVAGVMRSRWLSTGGVTKRFEAALRERTGYPYAVALSSCTAALFLALRAKGIGPGSRVGVPALTFTATAAAVEHTGASVRFVDVDPETWLMPDYPIGLDAIVPVDLYGQPAFPGSGEMEAVELNITVIEDAAHAVGAEMRDRAEIACLSFYATKNISTMGEGGALLTRSEHIAEWARRASLHGLSSGAWARFGGTTKDYGVGMAGYKANMTDCQSAMGLTQLGRLDEWRERREQIARRYDAELRMPTVPRAGNGIAHLYPVLLPGDVDRAYFRTRMAARGVGTGVHYRSLTDEPYWRDRYHASCPVAERIGRRVVSLPLYPHLTEEDQDTVIGAAGECLR